MAGRASSVLCGWSITTRSTPYAVRRLGVADDAGDAVADTFAVAWRRIAEVPPPPQDRLWLYGVARRVVAEALARLRPAEREALLLVVWDGLSYTETARVLGCSPNAAGLRVHKAKAKLRAALTPARQPVTTATTTDR
jgi:RNA polymerase sigma-70 factor, ECF subfamily